MTGFSGPRTPNNVHAVMSSDKKSLLIALIAETLDVASVIEYNIAANRWGSVLSIKPPQNFTFFEVIAVLPGNTALISILKEGSPPFLLAYYSLATGGLIKVLELPDGFNISDNTVIYDNKEVLISGCVFNNNKTTWIPAFINADSAELVTTWNVTVAYPCAYVWANTENCSL